MQQHARSHPQDGSQEDEEEEEEHPHDGQEEQHDEEEEDEEHEEEEEGHDDDDEEDEEQGEGHLQVNEERLEHEEGDEHDDGSRSLSQIVATCGGASFCGACSFYVAMGGSRTTMTNCPKSNSIASLRCTKASTKTMIWMSSACLSSMCSIHRRSMRDIFAKNPYRCLFYPSRGG